MVRYWASPALATPPDWAAYAGRVLLVVGTGGPKRLPVFQRLRALGLGRIVAVHAAPNWAAPYVDAWIAADAERPDGSAMAAVHAWLAAGGRVDGVITFDEYGVAIAAELAETLGLPGLGLPAARAARDKRAFRARCAAAGLPTPLVVPLDGPADADLAAVRAAGARYPLVVKPAGGAGSSFVTRVDDDGAFLAALARAREDVDPARPWCARALMAEAYLAGPEVDVDMLVQGGRVAWCAVSDNRSPAEPWFLEAGGHVPSALPAPDLAALRALAAGVVAALGVRDGCLHLEARVTAEGPVPLEANLRLGGAEVRAFHLVAHGLDLVDQAVRIALGKPLQAPGAPHRHAASVNFLPAAGGRIAGLVVAPWVPADPAFAELVLFKAPGDPIAVPPAGFDYLGWLVAAGDTAEAAEAALARLSAGVTATIAPDGV